MLRISFDHVKRQFLLKTYLHMHFTLHFLLFCVVEPKKMLRFADISLYTLEEEEGPSRTRSTRPRSSLPRPESSTVLVWSSSISQLAAAPEDGSLVRPPEPLDLMTAEGEGRNGSSSSMQLLVGSNTQEEEEEERGGGGSSLSSSSGCGETQRVDETWRPPPPAGYRYEAPAASRLWGRTWTAYLRHRDRRPSSPPVCRGRPSPSTNNRAPHSTKESPH